MTIMAMPVSAFTLPATAGRLTKLLGGEPGYGDLVPAMQQIVQATGRVLRTPEDRGWLWLLDDRYRRGEVVALLARWWRVV